jgi:hypothetical protein
MQLLVAMELCDENTTYSPMIIPCKIWGLAETMNSVLRPHRP